jgi:hypothetical protein
VRRRWGMMGTDEQQEILRVVRDHLTQVRQHLRLISIEVYRATQLLAEIEVPRLPSERTTPEGGRPRRGRKR